MDGHARCSLVCGRALHFGSIRERLTTPSKYRVIREFPFNAWRAIAVEFAAEFGGSWNGSHPLVALSGQSIVS
jgi:hypothetical protein